MPALSSLVRLMAVVCLAWHPAFAGTCGDIKVSTLLAAGSLPNAVQLDKGTTGQPFGGTLVFTIPTTALSKDGPPLVACFRMRPRDQHASEVLTARNQDQWTEDLPLRVLNSQTDVTTVSVEVPHSISSFKGNDPLSHKPPGDTYFAHNGFWPIADFRVMVVGANKVPVLDEIVPVNITNYWIPGLVAILGTVGFWWAMRALASKRKIPGGFLLSVIANQNGYASLSQLQIMMWTIVIGAASIYVVLLTGRLLDIPTPTLALLGIAGATTVAVAVPKAGTDPQAAAPAQGAAPAQAAAPGAVTDLRVVGFPGTDRVVLSWAPPDGGGTPTSYLVEQRTAVNGQPPGAWGPATGGANVQEAPVEITGLAANPRYQFRVTAFNAGIAGAPTPTDPVTIDPGAGAARPAQPQGVRPGTGAPQAEVVTVEWNPLVPIPEAYVVSLRRVGTTIWIVGGTTGPNGTSLDVGDLTGDVGYEFQVRAVAAGQIGPASAITFARTAVRTPQIIDLVVWDGTHEVDVTRLQMLFFTLVAAIFVVVKVVAQNEVPEIPQGLLLLMGLSNGVYLSSKFVSGRR